MFCLCVCGGGSGMPDSKGGQKRILDPVELESRMVVSHRVGPGNQTWVFLKNKRTYLTTESLLQLSMFYFLLTCLSVCLGEFLPCV